MATIYISIVRQFLVYLEKVNTSNSQISELSDPKKPYSPICLSPSHQSGPSRQRRFARSSQPATPSSLLSFSFFCQVSDEAREEFANLRRAFDKCGSSSPRYSLIFSSFCLYVYIFMWICDFFVVLLCFVTVIIRSMLSCLLSKILYISYCQDCIVIFLEMFLVWLGHVCQCRVERIEYPQLVIQRQISRHRAESVCRGQYNGPNQLGFEAQLIDYIKSCVGSGVSWSFTAAIYSYMSYGILLLKD